VYHAVFCYVVSGRYLWLWIVMGFVLCLYSYVDGYIVIWWVSRSFGVIGIWLFSYCK